MDEAWASQLVESAANRYRFLMGARVRRVLPLEGNVGVLVDQLDDSGFVRYAFALVVADTRTHVAFVITAEESELAAGTSQPHFLGRFDELGHHNHGRGDFRDVEVFATRATELSLELLRAR